MQMGRRRAQIAILSSTDTDRNDGLHLILAENFISFLR